MKTREINGWVYLDEDKNFTTMNFHQRIPDNFSEMKNVAKARLVLEIPEKKIEITESQFDEAWMKSEFGNTPEEHKKNVMKKLFGG